MRPDSDRTPSHRLDRQNAPSLQSWKEPPAPVADQMRSEAVCDCGWGRLIFGQTFRDPKRLLEVLRQEEQGRRDIALYLRDPHVVLSLAPQELFLDPSHTYRLWLDRYRPASEPPRGFQVRRVQSREDAQAVSDLYRKRHMAPVDPAFVLSCRGGGTVTWFVAVGDDGGAPIGAVTGVDHRRAFDDPERGSSLWSLAVDPQAPLPGVGEALTRHLAEHYQVRGCSYVDLSVMHDNAQAIKLYEKLGFERVPVFCVKLKNPFNEALYAAPAPKEQLNPYAAIIVDEALRRGIEVEIVDAEGGFFNLGHGARKVACRESLSDLVSAVALSRCDDKRVCSRLLSRAGLRVPEQILVHDPDHAREFLGRHGRVVVKPRRGEQGRGVSVDVRTWEDLEAAFETAARIHPDVLVERYVEGEDLRIIVIDGAMVAAAVRRPAEVVGTGRHTLQQLIEKQSRRRAAATGGESTIPVDAQTLTVIREAGFGLDDVLDAGRHVHVRRTANLHTGGTIHDVTDRVHPALAEVAVKASKALDIPVCGLDLIVEDVGRPDYVIVEVNERPGLANHEPQPTAERFLDFLFPRTTPEHRP